MINLKNEKNKSAVILNPERSEWVSRSHVTSVESVVNDGAKTQCYSAKRDLYGPSLRSTLKMTALSFLLSLNLSTSWATVDGGTCGTGCNWSYDTETKVLNVLADSGTSNVNMTDFEYEGLNDDYLATYDTPWKNYASDIETVNIGEGIKYIGGGALAGLANLNTVSVPDSVTAIGPGAFADNYKLTELNLPNVTTIYAGAYDDAGVFEGIGLGTDNGASVYIPKVESLSNDAFFSAKLNDLDVSSVKTIDDCAFCWAYLPDGVVEFPSLTTLDWYPFDNAVVNTLFMPNLETIGDYGFEAYGYGDNPARIEISDSLVNVGEWGLQMYGDMELIMPDSLDVSNFPSEAFDIGFGNGSLTIKCKGDQSVCEEKMKKFIKGDPEQGYCGTDWCTLTSEQVTFAPITEDECSNGFGMYEWKDGKCQRMGENNCNETDSYYYNGNTCTRRPKNGQVACSSSYKANDGYCDRIRYTPAEAAQVLKNDNTNEVVITFKK